MAKARVNGIDLYYEVHGEGEPLVFISGLGGHVAEVPYLAESYGRRFRFVAFDGRGCGRSDKPDGEYSIAGYADDAAALLDAIGIESATVYGSSMGGMVAQELALGHPAKVRALILGCTSGGVGGVGPSAETIGRAMRAQSLSGDEALAAGWELGYSAAYIARNYDELLERSRFAAQFATPRDPYLRQMMATARHDAFGRLGAITCPVMIIHGSGDVMLPVENARMLKLAIPHAELHILDGMGHGYNLEAQEMADDLVIDFVRRHGSVSKRSASAAR